MAFTEKYVSVAGGGAHDGSSEANAYTWAEMVTALNLLAPAGAATRYNVKQGTYTFAASTTLSGDGTATYPIVVRGYKTTIGDATLGRSSDGTLDTSNMPTLDLSGGSYQIAASGSQYITFEALNITSARAGDAVALGTQANVVNCKVANSSTNAAATAILGGSGSRIVACDLSTGASGGTAAMNCGSGNFIIGCRIKSAGAIGINASSVTAIGNVIYECGTSGIDITSTSGASLIAFNTIVGCTGDGINMPASLTAAHNIFANHITDNGGYGSDFNTSTAYQAFYMYNRTRDNTSGATNGANDWVSGTASVKDVTTDSGGASTDYRDQTTDDYRLIASAAGVGQSFLLQGNIGAAQNGTGGGLTGYGSA